MDGNLKENITTAEIARYVRNFLQGHQCKKVCIGDIPNFVNENKYRLMITFEFIQFDCKDVPSKTPYKVKMLGTLTKEHKGIFMSFSKILRIKDLLSKLKHQLIQLIWISL